MSDYQQAAGRETWQWLPISPETTELQRQAQEQSTRGVCRTCRQPVSTPLPSD